MTAFKAAYPIDIETKVLQYKESKPLVLKIQVTNPVKDRITVSSFLTKCIMAGSDTIENGLIKKIKTSLEKPSVLSAKKEETGYTIALNHMETGVLKIIADIEIKKYSRKNVEKNPRSFIIIPMTLTIGDRTEVRTLLVSLSRYLDNSLKVNSEILSTIDDRWIKIFIRSERFQQEIERGKIT